MFECDPNCGACCMNVSMVPSMKKYELPDKSCSNLDPKTRLCKIYETRPLVCRIEELYDRSPELREKYKTKKKWIETNREQCEPLRKIMIEPLTYPARPMNGGPKDKSPPKPGMWLYTPKHDGHRTLIHTPSSTMFNRRGELYAHRGKYAAVLEELKTSTVEWIDAEALGQRSGNPEGTLIVLDLPSIDETFEERAKIREGLFENIGFEKPEPERIYTLVEWEGENGLDHLWDEGKKHKEIEGVVGKKADSKYPIQLKSPDQKTWTWVKHLKSDES